MEKLPKLLPALLLVVVCGVPSAAESTTMQYATLPDLVEMSDLIVRGAVVDQRTFVEPETERITTRTTIDDEWVYFGNLERDRFEVEQWGGTVGERTVEIPGDARFEVGEEVVLFLEYNDGPGAFPAYLVAMGQAKFRVEYGEDGQTVRRSAAGIVYLDATRPSERLELPIGIRSFEARLESLIYAIKGESPDGP